MVEKILSIADYLGDMKEQKIQKEISDNLRKLGWLVIKFSNVGIYNKKTNAYIPPVQKGISDLICLYNGKFIAIEVKKPKMCPTLYQEQFLADVKKNGGYALTAHSWIEVVNFCIKHKIDNRLKIYQD